MTNEDSTSKSLIWRIADSIVDWLASWFTEVVQIEGNTTRFEWDGPIMETILEEVDPSTRFLFSHEKLPEFNKTIRQRFQLIEPLSSIGKGAFGRIFQSSYRDNEGNRQPIVLKVVLVRRPSPEPAILINQLNKFAIQGAGEAILMGTLHHENILRIIDFVELMHDELHQPFACIMALEWMSCSFGNILDTEFLEPVSAPRKLQHIYQLALQIGRALLYLHQQKISHHDIKPDNILVNILFSGGKIFKIADFGNAQRYSFPSNARSSQTLRHHGGTWAYLAPERRGVRTGGRKAYNPYLLDSYAFGATLVTAVVGKEAICRVIDSNKRNLGAFWTDQCKSQCLVSREALAESSAADPSRVWNQQINAFEAIGSLIERNKKKRAFIDEEWLKCFEN